MAKQLSISASESGLSVQNYGAI